MKKPNKRRLSIGLLSFFALAALAVFLLALAVEEIETAYYCCLFLAVALLRISQLREQERLEEGGRLLSSISPHLQKHFQHQKSVRDSCFKAVKLLSQGGQNNLEKALALLLKAEKKARYRQDQGAVLFLSARMLKDLDRLREAVDSLRKSVELDADNPDAWNILGVLLIKTEGSAGYELAEQAYRRALSLNPDFALAMGNLGMLYYRRRIYGTAREWLKSALEKRERPSFLSALALVEASQGNAEAAWHCYRQAERAEYQNLIGLRQQIEEELREKGRSTWRGGAAGQGRWEQFNKEWLDRS